MSDLNDENARAAARLAHDRVQDLVSHFSNSRDASWDTFGPGKSGMWLEQTKMDLVMLASVVESRIQEISTTVQDFGT